MLCATGYAYKGCFCQVHVIFMSCRLSVCYISIIMICVDIIIIDTPFLKTKYLITFYRSIEKIHKDALKIMSYTLPDIFSMQMARREDNNLGKWHSTVQLSHQSHRAITSLKLFLHCLNFDENHLRNVEESKLRLSQGFVGIRN